MAVNRPALSPVQISYNGQPLVKVSCGAEFSMVVDCKGNLYSFGCPEYGQLGRVVTHWHRQSYVSVGEILMLLKTSAVPCFTA